MSNGQELAKNIPSTLRCRRTLLRVVVGFVLIVAVTHPWWLRRFGEFLAAEEPFSRADVAIVLSGDHRLQQAADLLHEETIGGIWLLEREPTYAVSAGILPPTHAVEAEELKSLGIPHDRIHVLPGGIRDIDDAARVIARSAGESPTSTVVVLCQRAHSRNLRLVLERVAMEPSAPRVAILGLPSDRYDEGSWWKSRTGWKDVFNATCHLAFTLIHGVDRDREASGWDPDDYERRIVSSYGDRGCHASE